MSDSHGTTGNPYGDPQDSGPSGPPPSPPNPYDPSSTGQPTPGQQPDQPASDQPSPGQNPYGVAPPAPYGQPRTQSFSEMYGQAPQQLPSDYAVHGYGGDQRVVDKRPGTVTAASVITLIFSGLAAALFGISLIGLVVARQEVTDAIDDELAKQPGMENVVADDITTVILVVVAIVLVWSLIACLLAVLVLRRSGIARILLVISSAVTALGSLLSIGGGVPVITLAASVAVIVLLFVGGANEWFRSKNQPSGLRLS